MKNKGISLKRLIKSFGYAFNGLRLMIIQEQNAKLHLLAVLLVVVAGEFGCCIFCFPVFSCTFVVLFRK